jgi:hypothetical protein
MHSFCEHASEDIYIKKYIYIDHALKILSEHKNISYSFTISLAELSFVSLSYTSAMGYLQDFLKNFKNHISEIHSIQSNSSSCSG